MSRFNSDHLIAAQGKDVTITTKDHKVFTGKMIQTKSPHLLKLKGESGNVHRIRRSNIDEFTVKNAVRGGTIGVADEPNLSSALPSGTAPVKRAYKKKVKKEVMETSAPSPLSWPIEGIGNSTREGLFKVISDIESRFSKDGQSRVKDDDFDHSVIYSLSGASIPLLMASTGLPLVECPFNPRSYQIDFPGVGPVRFHLNACTGMANVGFIDGDGPGRWKLTEKGLETVRMNFFPEVVLSTLVGSSTLGDPSENMALSPLSEKLDGGCLDCGSEKIRYPSSHLCINCYQKRYRRAKREAKAVSEPATDDAVIAKPALREFLVPASLPSVEVPAMPYAEMADAVAKMGLALVEFSEAMRKFGARNTP